MPGHVSSVFQEHANICLLSLCSKEDAGAKNTSRATSTATFSRKDGLCAKDCEPDLSWLLHISHLSFNTSSINLS